jgi:hypothetical protein
MEDLAENNEQQEQVIMQKPKKPRTKAQIEATEKMLLAKKVRRDEEAVKKNEQNEKFRLEEERLQQKLEEKILKKAMALKRKRQMKEEVLDLVCSEPSSPVAVAPPVKKEIQFVKPKASQREKPMDGKPTLIFI